MYYVSVTILGAFAVELVLLMCVLGLHFARQPLYMLDAAVVGTALVVEVYLRGHGHNPSGELAGLLIFARSWRFVRIGHGLSTSVHEAGHKHVEEMEHHIKELEDELSLTPARKQSADCVDRRDSTRLLSYTRRPACVTGVWARALPLALIWSIIPQSKAVSVFRDRAKCAPLDLNCGRQLRGVLRGLGACSRDSAVESWR
eukprot:1382729-Prymnesium_polylepis.1